MGYMMLVDVLEALTDSQQIASKQKMLSNLESLTEEVNRFSNSELGGIIEFLEKRHNEDLTICVGRILQNVQNRTAVVTWIRSQRRRAQVLPYRYFIRMDRTRYLLQHDHLSIRFAHCVKDTRAGLRTVVNTLQGASLETVPVLASHPHTLRRFPSSPSKMAPTQVCTEAATNIQTPEASRNDRARKSHCSTTCYQVAPCHERRT